MFSGGLLGVFNRETAPAFTPSRCLNRRNRFDPCRLCVDACPTGALTRETGRILIEEKKCVGCGLCSAACPSEALRVRDYPLFRRFAGMESPLELRCLRSGGGYCLRSVDSGLWAALMLLKAECEFMFIMPCEDCELAGKNTDFLDAALDFLRTLNVRPKIEIKQDAAFEREVSRRELLSSFLTWGKERGKNILEDMFWHDGNDVFLARRFLADKLEENKLEGWSLYDGIFHDFVVSGSCDGCGACEGVCPAGAWCFRRVVEEQKTELRFDRKECSGCGLCLKQCPCGAITPRLEFQWANGPIIKREFPMFRCRHCGMWFLQRKSEQELCDSCSKYHK